MAKKGRPSYPPRNRGRVRIEEVRFGVFAITAVWDWDDVLSFGTFSLEGLA